MKRWHWLAVVAAAAVACGGSGKSGGTTGASATTGGQTALAAGSACAANAACASGICGLSGTGNCCSGPCSTEDSACGAIGCDSTGACSYPASSTACSRCSDGMLTPGSCDGLGICASPGAPTACPGHLGCDSSGLACATACTTSAQCGSGFFCSSGACVAPSAVGPCTENAACTSGVCGVAGSGHCCTAVCQNVAAPCGATDCDDSTGACRFPANSVSCGAAASCAGMLQTNPGACDGRGDCTQRSTDCSPFVCGASACLSSCTDASSCIAGDFCDVTSSGCCPALPSGATLTVDGLNGSDATACCGYAGNGPCLTIARAMKLIDSAAAPNVTISAVLGGGNDPISGSWAPSGEVYPIVLGWGVELLAPGISFVDQSGAHGETFDIAPYSAKDTVGYASIAGTQGYRASAGMSSAMKYTPDPNTIQVEPGQTLYLANITVNGDANGSANAINVLKGATLVLGQDQSTGVVGTVDIGVAGGSVFKGVYRNDGWIGIVCQGCAVADYPGLTEESSVVFQGQVAGDIQAGDSSAITLSSAPVIGAAPGSASFNTCLSKQDASAGQAAISLTGTATMTLDNATVQCIAGDGFDLNASDAGAPALVLQNSKIQNTERAIYAAAGSAKVFSSTIQFNYDGVVQAADGSIDLESPDGGVNTVVCSSSIESIHGSGGTPGVDVLNTGSAALDADGVAWDTVGPDLFSCDAGLLECSCQIASCTNPGGVDGMDVVTTSTGTVSTVGNTLSPVSCTPICYGAPPCAAGDVCCSTSPLDARSFCNPPGKACL